MGDGFHSTPTDLATHAGTVSKLGDRLNQAASTGGGVDVGGETFGIIGQAFAAPQYFHPRPSAAGADGYDATASGASNLGPTNPKLEKAVADRARAYRAENGLAADAPVPVDAVTASASGLDPAISVANARDQAPRVARERAMAVDRVLALVQAHTTGRALGVLGEPSVNVLELNLALDGSR